MGGNGAMAYTENSFFKLELLVCIISRLHGILECVVYLYQDVQYQVTFTKYKPESLNLSTEISKIWFLTIYWQNTCIRLS